MTTAALLTLLVMVSCITSLVLGAHLARKHAEGRLARAADREAKLRHEVADLTAQVRTQDQMLDAFSAVAGTTLQGQSTQLLQQADHQWDVRGQQLLEVLAQHAEHLRKLEAERRDDATGIRTQVESLVRANEQVRVEAGNLAGALKNNSVRGLWGEVQLRQVLESCGMLANCDFVEQSVVRGAEGRLRPDVVVRLPNGRCVVIDAKAPLDHYMAAAAETDPQRRSELITKHARAVADHAKQLSKRDYRHHVAGSIDLVVMFVPGDPFLTAALEGQPGLLEDAFGQDVVLTTPSSLFALLRGVAAGWREQRVTEEAERIAGLGRELHERIATFAAHFTAVGSSLTTAVSSYNSAIGSMESRLLVTARRFEEMGATSGKAIPGGDPINALPRPTAAPELMPATESGTDIGVA